ncbi:hypothetical protein [Janibacter sp. LM]|uniref:hypothetical protein n=1 Tax=Janibacter sp. LM TaxID=3144845 RepID=UPI0031F61366
MSEWIETRHLDGTLRKAWTYPAGYVLNGPLEEPQPSFERQTVHSPLVDGEFQTHSSIGALRYPMHVMVQAANPAQLEARVQAFIADVTATHALLLRVVLGPIATTWRAYRPDVVSTADVGIALSAGAWREVELDWPVLPHPEIVGAVA